MKAVVEPMTRPRVFAARAIAIAADFLQIFVFPAFSEGGVSPLDAAVDVAVAGSMTALVGWHWAFLPSFAAELVPFVDLVPTWTAAVFIVTRPSRRGAPAAPKPRPPTPSPASARGSGAAGPGGEGE
ncbi:MAG TPA: hypothetical protein VKH46_13740 [Thermoanaerobaculia bacterium]|jgi:hypothetical protein|nr:hypothetical protein [Thermoanaerobaculia bacterium]